MTKKAKNGMKHTLDEFFADADDLLLKLPSIQDFDQRDFVKSISNRCEFSNNEGTSSDVSEEVSADNDLNWLETAAFVAAMLPVGFAYGLTNGLTGGRIWHDWSKDDARKRIDEMRFSFDASPLLNNIITNKDNVVSEIKKAFIDELLSPLQAQLDEVRQEGIDKEQKLSAAKDRLESLVKQKSTLEDQIKHIQEAKNV